MVNLPDPGRDARKRAFQKRAERRLLLKSVSQASDHMQLRATPNTLVAIVGASAHIRVKVDRWHVTEDRVDESVVAVIRAIDRRRDPATKVGYAFLDCQVVDPEAKSPGRHFTLFSQVEPVPEGEVRLTFRGEDLPHHLLAWELPPEYENFKAFEKAYYTAALPKKQSSEKTEESIA